jgi:hypothetical protein
MGARAKHARIPLLKGVPRVSGRDYEVVSTYFSSSSRYDVVRFKGETGLFFTGKVFGIYKNGDYWKGDYHDLRDAVERAEKAAKRNE